MMQSTRRINSNSISRILLLLLSLAASGAAQRFDGAMAMTSSSSNANYNDSSRTNTTRIDGADVMESHHADADDADECGDAPLCFALFRTTVVCVIHGNATCGDCLPGYINTTTHTSNATKETPCTAEDDASLSAAPLDPLDHDDDDDDDDSRDRYEAPARSRFSMEMQTQIGTAMGSLVVLLMCVVTWRGWLDCCCSTSSARTRDRHRAFGTHPATNDWSCAVCLHANAALCRQCLLCHTERVVSTVSPSQRRTAMTTTGAADENGHQYTPLETPRSNNSNRNNDATATTAAAAASPGASQRWDTAITIATATTNTPTTASADQRVAMERLEWKRCICNGSMRWMRFQVDTVRRYPCLQGTIVDAKDLQAVVLPVSRRKDDEKCSFFVRMENPTSSMVYDWVLVQHAVYDTRVLGSSAHWRHLRNVAAWRFDERVRWLYQELLKLRNPFSTETHTLHIRRNEIVEQSVAAIGSLSSKMLRLPFRVDFVGEPGVDGGGLLREWLHLVCKELFAPSLGMFQQTQSILDTSKSYWIKPYDRRGTRSAVIPTSHLSKFTFFGKLLGKSLLEGLVLNVRFSVPLLKHLLEAPLSLHDLQYLDDQVYKSVTSLLTFDRSNQSQIEELCLTFCIAGVDLIPNGSNVQVTKTNTQQYVEKVVQYYLCTSVQEELRCLLHGFKSVFVLDPKQLLGVFDHKELDLVLSGSLEIDIVDWQAHTNINMIGRRPAHEKQVVNWFWQIVDEEMDQKQRKQLLQFVTGSSGVPVEGFAGLTSVDGKLQPFTIQLVDNFGFHAPPKADLLPYACTCFNRLDLPVYETKEELQHVLAMLTELDVTGFNRR